MNGNYSRFIKSILITGDLLMINIAFALGYLIKFKASELSQLLKDEYLVLFLVYNVAWIIASLALRIYERDRLFLMEKMLIKLVRLLIIHSLLITAFWVIRKAFFYSREQLMWTIIILYPLIFLWRFAISMAIKNYRKKGYNYKKIVVIGAGELAQQFITVINKNIDYGYKVVGVFDDKNGDSLQPILPLDKVESFCLENKVDEIYCSSSDLMPEKISQLTKLADNHLMRVKIIPDVRGFANKRLNIDFFEHMPVLSFRNLPLDDTFNRLLKRLFDITFSIIVIVFILSWLFPVVAILIKLSSKGPVLFKQKRSGINNQNFNCLKFRSMKLNNDSDVLQSTEGDSRITKIGRFLRRSSLDEMPQFFNVLIGEMSIVGPRPHMIKHTEEYSQLINKYMVRHFVKPGITGLAQIKGFRGETKNPKLMENRIRMDMLYVESWTMALDFWIILRTVFTLFTNQNNAR